MLPTVAPDLSVPKHFPQVSACRQAPLGDTPRLSVPRHIGAAERVTAERFEASFGVPYKPRQVTDDHPRATCSGPAAGATIIWLAEHRERRGLPRHGANSQIRHEEPAPGQWAAAGACWWTREHYLQQVAPVIAADHLQLLKRHGVGRDTFLRWVRHESLYARQQHNGREVIVRPDTIAGLMRCRKRQVQRCRAAGRQIGLYVDLIPGRMLDFAEITQAREAGSPQRGLSNVSSFVVPAAYTHLLTRPQPVRHVTPTRGRSSLKKTSLERYSSSLKTRSAKVKGASQAPHAPTKRVSPALRLAIDLTRKAVWLHSTSPRRLAGQLTVFATQPNPWSAADLVEEIDQIQRRLGYSTPHRAQISPWALLRWYLDQINPRTASYRQRRSRALRRPWCGRCHSADHRWIDHPDHTTRPCPRCSPQATSAELRLVSSP